MTQETAKTVDPDETLARSGLYRLLARLWAREPDTELLALLDDAQVSAVFTEAGGRLPDLTEDVLEDLAIEYCRLFVGPSGHFPPVQSVWQQGQFQAASATSMCRYADVTGYELEQRSGGMMPDHLAVQLDLMSDILEQLAQASDASRSTAIEELAGAYHATHLQWPSEFLQAARSRAESDFYRSVIDLTERFLESEAA